MIFGPWVVASLIIGYLLFNDRNGKRNRFAEIHGAFANRRSSLWMNFIDAQLAAIGSPWTAQQFLVIAGGFICGLALFSYLFLRSIPVTLSVFVLSMYMPWWWLQRMRSVKEKEISRLAPSLFYAFRSRLYGSRNVATLIDEISNSPLSPEPLGGALRELVRGLRMNVPVEDLLEHFNARIKHPHLQFLIHVLLMSNSTGAEIRPILKLLSEREEKDRLFKAKVEKSIQGNSYTAYFLMLVFGFVILFYRFFRGDFYKILLTHPWGQAALAAAFLIIVGCWLYFDYSRRSNGGYKW